jgi:hypothetical protein
VIEQDFNARQLLNSLEQETRRLELLALHDERMPGVVGQYGMIEFSDETIRRTIPELEDRGNESDARHVVGQPEFGKQIEGSWMRGRGPRVGLQAVVIVEQADGDTAPA